MLWYTFYHILKYLHYIIIQNRQIYIFYQHFLRNMIVVFIVCQDVFFLRILVAFYEPIGLLSFEIETLAIKFCIFIQLLK